jgi:hypothetical protein
MGSIQSVIALRELMTNYVNSVLKHVEASSSLYVVFIGLGVSVTPGQHDISFF